MLADIRLDVDDVIGRSPGQRLRIVNSSHGPRFADGGPDPLELRRRDGDVLIADHDMSDMLAALGDHRDSWLLLTNLSQPDVKMMSSRAADRHERAGFSHRHRILASSRRPIHRPTATMALEGRPR